MTDKIAPKQLATVFEGSLDDVESTPMKSVKKNTKKKAIKK